MKTLKSWLLMAALMVWTAAMAQTNVATHRPVPVPLYGVTLDNVARINNITTALSSLAKRPTARVVFDEFVDPDYYRTPMVRISQVAYTMGEILDSAYVDRYTVDGYLQRTNQYLNALSDVVDIWEIGNEINGEWLGANSDVVAKMTGAYNIVNSQGKATALTLYYNQGCWERPENEMFRWAQANVPAYMKTGLNYVFISYYEDDCNGQRVNWQPVFDRLHAMFPNAKIGMGEVGTQRKRQKVNYMTRYYTMQITTPNYVGGHFWWYWYEDAVPMTKDFWTSFNNVLKTLP